MDNENAEARSARLEELRAHARQMVASLSAAEVSILKDIVAGNSDRAMAARHGKGLDEIRILRASLMDKLDARRIADAVRVGIYAGLDLPN